MRIAFGACVHSDRGAHYRCPGWLSRIADAAMRPTSTPGGRCCGPTARQSLWRRALRKRRSRRSCRGRCLRLVGLDLSCSGEGRCIEVGQRRRSAMSRAGLAARPGHRAGANSKCPNPSISESKKMQPLRRGRLLGPCRRRRDRWRARSACVTRADPERSRGRRIGKGMKTGGALRSG